MTIRYMGSKRSLAPLIAQLIGDRGEGAIVVDAFAGTCAVASAVAPRHTVYINDVHAFATVIGRALLAAPSPKPTVVQAVRDLRAPFLDNYRLVESAIRDRLDRETRALCVPGWETLRDFSLSELDSGPLTKLPSLPTLEDYQRDIRRVPFVLFSLIYASTYIGVRQAAELDSLRYAIEQAPSPRRDYYLFALLSALSHCCSAPGHFAQPLIPRDAKNTTYIRRIRRRGVWDRFLSALRDLKLPTCAARQSNRVFQSEATTFIRELPLATQGRETVVYADPPYSRAQYSRYYHLLETAVLYDYPSVSGKGRYRERRFFTDFSRPAQVERAMRSFVSEAAQTKSSLVLSYPRNGLLSEAGVDIFDLLQEHYAQVTVAATVGLSHSTLGGAPGVVSKEVFEDVYYAKSS